jgi:Zn ribbon nucleic-acid-binding protein
MKAVEDVPQHHPLPGVGGVVRLVAFRPPKLMMIRCLPWLSVCILIAHVATAWIPAPPIVAKKLFAAGWDGGGTSDTPEFPSTSPQDSALPDVARRGFGSRLLSISSLLFPAAFGRPADAAPPVSVMMEELGYFPVRDNKAELVYVPARVQRESSPQAIELAKYLQRHDISMAGAFWCPHCRRQRELFGQQAWAMIPYRECAAQGYQHQTCPSQVTGYPTWLRGRKGEVVASGEVPLAVLAEKVGFQGFDDALEQNVPQMIGASSCGK